MNLFSFSLRKAAGRVTLLSFFLCAAVGYSKVLPPMKQAGESIGLIFIQGMQVDASAYEPLAVAIQKESQLAVWVALVNFPLNVPNPLLYYKVTEDARAALKQAGMPGDTYYIVGHSLGGIVAQSQDINLRGGFEDGRSGANPPRVQGMVLMGSYVTRKNQFILSEMPILTLGGELDGLTRIGRMAEAFARQIDMSPNKNDARIKSPVVVLPGVNHKHFFSGNAPFLVRTHDLASTLPQDTAHNELAKVIAAFIAANREGSQQAADLLKRYEDATEELVRPLIDAMQLEGSYHLLQPCTSRAGEAVDQNHCLKGSPWAERAFAIMAGPLPHVTYQITNVFHESWRVFPFFHTHILNTCPLGVDCVMRLDSAAQNVYSIEDDQDTAFVPVAAAQMRVKMKSRQAILEAAGYGVKDFKKTDEWNACAAINNEAWQWAQEHAPAATLARFKQSGVPLVMGDDIPENAGPGFIWTDIAKKSVTLPNGSKALELRSQTMRTPLDFPVPGSVGYHFCKLVSPAWFMDYIYTDGIRPH